MHVISRLVRNTVTVSCVLVVMASPAAAGGARYFKDWKPNGSRIELRATPHRLLSGLFVADRGTMKCEDGGVFIGGFPVKSARIVDGRFRTVATGYFGEGGTWRLVLRGALRGATIRGAVSLRFVNRGADGRWECWSGRSKGDPLIRYVARAGG